MSGRESVRSAARRAIGVPDASEVGDTLREFQATLDALQSGIDALQADRANKSAELDRLRQELDELRRVILEQAAAIERLQGQRTSGPGH